MPAITQAVSVGPTARQPRYRIEASNHAGGRDSVDASGEGTDAKEGVDGILDCHGAAWESQDLPRAVVGVAANAGSSSVPATATTQVGTSAKSRCRSKSAIYCGQHRLKAQAKHCAGALACWRSSLPTDRARDRMSSVKPLPLCWYVGVGQERQRVSAVGGDGQ
jgi:hypothetical protein